MSDSKTAVWDGAGILASIACLIHCVALPILLSFFPALNVGFLDSENFHWIAAILATLIAFVTLRRGYRRNLDHSVLVLGVSGSFLLMLAALNPGETFTEQQESIVTILGCFALVIAHAANLRHSRQTPHTHAGRLCR